MSAAASDWLAAAAGHGVVTVLAILVGIVALVRLIRWARALVGLAAGAVVAYNGAMTIDALVHLVRSLT